MYASAGVGAVTDNRMIISELLIFLVAKRNEKNTQSAVNQILTNHNYPRSLRQGPVDGPSGKFSSQFLAPRSSRWTFRQVFQPILSVKVQPMDLQATFPANSFRQGPTNGPSGNFSGRLVPGGGGVCARSGEELCQVCVFLATWNGKTHKMPKSTPGDDCFCRPGTCRRIWPPAASTSLSLRGGSFTSIAQTPTVRSTFGICHKQRTQANRCDLALRATSRPPAGGH